MKEQETSFANVVTQYLAPLSDVSVTKLFQNGIHMSLELLWVNVGDEVVCQLFTSSFLDVRDAELNRATVPETRCVNFTDHMRGSYGYSVVLQGETSLVK